MLYFIYLKLWTVSFSEKLEHIQIILRWMLLDLFSAATMSVINSMCWKVVARTVDSSGIGIIIYQKPTSPDCYGKRDPNTPPLCQEKDGKNSSWYLTIYVVFCFFS